MMVRSAYSSAATTALVADDVIAQLDDAQPRAVLFFADARFDGAAISAVLCERWPGVHVIGCTTAGEFNEHTAGTGGVSAIALPASKVARVHAELVGLREGVRCGVRGAIDRVEAALKIRLRELDPNRWLGFTLIDGLHGDEELVNVELGKAAPYLSFVGASAGDNLAFEQTRAYCNGGETNHGAAFMLLEFDVPFAIVKACSFEPAASHFNVTRADVAGRVVYELDGRPVLDAYADALGITPAAIDNDVFMAHPLGLMIDGEPWIRSPRAITPDGGLKFYCQIGEGVDVHVMNSGDLIADTRASFQEARRQLGGSAAGAVLFNCILRRLDFDKHNLHDEWLASFVEQPTAGFHTYGESWLGHITQTCMGVFIG